MITLKKLNRKKASYPLLRRPLPAPYFHLPFYFFRFLPLGEVFKIYFPLLKKKKKGGESELSLPFVINMTPEWPQFILFPILKRNHFSLDFSLRFIVEIIYGIMFLET